LSAHTDRRTDAGLIALPGPLKWSVNIVHYMLYMLLLPLLLLSSMQLQYEQNMTKQNNSFQHRIPAHRHTAESAIFMQCTLFCDYKTTDNVASKIVLISRCCPNACTRRSYGQQHSGIFLWSMSVFCCTPS